MDAPRASCVGIQNVVEANYTRLIRAWDGGMGAAGWGRSGFAVAQLNPLSRMIYRPTRANERGTIVCLKRSGMAARGGGL